MNASKAAHLIRQKHFVMLLSILISCALLFTIDIYLDKDADSLLDLFTIHSLFALVVYFLPTYGVCLLLLALFEYRHMSRSMLLSLSLGIPLGFFLVILTLLTLR